MRVKITLKSYAALLGVVAAGLAFNAHGEIAVSDDTNTPLKLAAPAKRIVSLAPHVTELLFAVGAGKQVVGTVDYSDYPAAAKAIPKVGGYSKLDLEAIVALKPDLIIGWESGNHAASVQKLRSMGLPVYLTQPNKLEEIPSVLERFGKLAGTEVAAKQAARQFRERQAKLTSQYSHKPNVPVFYQVWKQPLMTVNGKQIISDVLRICGGSNVFADLPILAPTVTAEAVIAINPEVILASGMGQSRPDWVDDWRRWGSLTAVKRNNLYFIPPDLLQRHTPRILDGAEKLCHLLDEARQKRK